VIISPLLRIEAAAAKLCKTTSSASTEPPAQVTPHSVDDTDMMSLSSAVDSPVEVFEDDMEEALAEIIDESVMSMPTPRMPSGAASVLGSHSSDDTRPLIPASQWKKRKAAKKATAKVSVKDRFAKLVVRKKPAGSAKAAAPADASISAASGSAPAAAPADAFIAAASSSASADASVAASSGSAPVAAAAADAVPAAEVADSAKVPWVWIVTNVFRSSLPTFPSLSLCLEVFF
jgi:hypothetical protein